jgi:hypothetical protein
VKFPGTTGIPACVAFFKSFSITNGNHIARFKEALDRGRVLLFPLPNRGLKEDGGREAKVQQLDQETWAVIWLCLRGSCRLPRFMAPPGTVKSFRRTARGT